jgi:inorganic triphosphatase YgiF
VNARALTHESQDSKEIELKLAFNPADRARILSHPVLDASGIAPDENELISVYYDTDDGALRKAGVFLRVRRSGSRYVQTIKAVRSEAELLERLEWEREVFGLEPNLDAAEGTALAALLTPDVRATLRPRFETRFRRKAYRIKRDASEIEVAIDQGEIIAGPRLSPISELELELKQGEKRELFRLARILAETVPLRLAVKAKAERGFALLDGSDRDVEKAGDVHVTPEMTTGEAFRVIARSCLWQIVANEPAVYDGRPEALHQMRIGLRRLRAAVSLFADVVAGEDLDQIKAEFKWITRELGPARDFDVFGAEVIEPLKAAHPEDPGIAAVYRDFEEKRAAAYARATDSIRSDRFHKALLDLAAWIETGAWASEDEAQRSVTKLATKDLARLRKKIKKRGPRLRDLSPAQRHRLRIRAKRLRYATEFFASTFPGKESERRRETSLAALKDLQDDLGALNDLATRRTLLTAGGEGEAQTLKLGPAGADEAKLLETAEEAYARFAGVKSFWKA